MKKIIMLINNLSGNVISSLILVVILTYSLISVENMIGSYRYITFSEYILSNESLADSDYFMLDPVSLNMDEQYNHGSGKLINKISSFKGVKGVADSSKTAAYFRSSVVNLDFYNRYMTEAFNNILSEGRWFTHSENSTDCIEAVVCGAIFNDLPVGSKIELAFPNVKETLKVEVVGKVGYPWYAPDYSSISDEVSSGNFLVEANFVMLDDNESNRKMLPENVEPRSLGLSFFVLYDNDCTSAQRNAVRDLYESVGSYKSYDEILKNTHDKIQNDLITGLVTPIFMLAVSTILLISIAVMTVYKKLREHTIYYLCGCSRRQSFLYLVFGVSIPVFISVIINTIYVAVKINNLASGVTGYEGVIFDYNNIWFGILYCIVTVTVAMILPYIVFRSNTPVEIYRRNHND